MTSLKMELLGLGASFHVNRFFGTSETKKSYQQNYQNELKTDVDSGGKKQEKLASTAKMNSAILTCPSCRVHLSTACPPTSKTPLLSI